MSGVADALMQPFVWGAGGQKLTKDEIARQRAIADALKSPADYQPTGPWGLVGGLASDVSSALKGKRADAAETENRSAADALYGGLSDGYDANELMTLAGNENLSGPQSAVAQALLQQQMKKDDPAYQLGIDKTEAEIAALKAKPPQQLINAGNGAIYDPNSGKWITQTTADGTKPPNAKAESDLRTEYNGINTVKDFGLQTQAYQRVLDSARDPSAAGDLALIFNYMKVLDPGSTVREGEFATAQNSGSIPEQIWAQYNKAMSGERLVPEIRKDFVKRAGQLFEGAATLQNGTNQRYSDLATQYGYDPARIIAEVPKIGVLDPEFKLEEFLDPKTGQQTKPLPVTNEADYSAVPSGAQYVDPDGNVRVKK